MSIPVTRPTLRRKDFNGVLSCLVSDRIGPGQLSAELASGLARLVGARGGLCLSSYAAAIDRALDLLALAPGDVLALPALAPSIYREVCRRRGIRVILVDVQERSPLPDPAALERLLSGAAAVPTGSRMDLEPGRPPAGADAPKALVLHHTLGFVPETDELLRLGIPVLEDVSHALGGAWNSGPCGSHGQVTVLSLQPEGIITAGGGGVVFVRERRAGRGLSEAQGQLDRDQLLPDMNAALGLIQLKELDRFLRARREIAAVFHQAVSRSRHGALLAGPQAAETAEREGAHTGSASDPALGVPYALAVTVRGAIREVRQYASRQGIETRRAFAEAALAFHPGAVESADAGGDGSASGGTPAEPERVPATASSAAVPADDRAAMLREFPRAHELLLRSVLFPLYPGLSKKDVQLIAKVLATLP